MRPKSMLVLMLIGLFANDVSARIPPPAVSLDVLLTKADRIVIGRVVPGSVKSIAGPDKATFHELTLVVTRSLDAKEIGKQVTVTLGSFPARVFPPTKAHPSGRYLLSGWDIEGFTDQDAKGLDLYVEQVWFLQPFQESRLRNPKTAPHGVNHFESVQALQHAALIELFIQKAEVAKLRQHVANHYRGKIPRLAMEGLYGTSDPGAGELIWDYLKHYAGVSQRIAALQEKGELAKANELIRSQHEISPYAAFRTLNSLGSAEAVKYARKSLEPSFASLHHYACYTIRRYQDTESVPRLLQILATSNDADERETIIATLGELGDSRAIPVLIARLPDDSPDEPVARALFQLTDLRLSPNVEYAKRWWERNKDRPRWHWLKQGIEQDLHILGGPYPSGWEGDFDPLVHLARVTCWRQAPRKNSMPDPDLTAAWNRWWQANKDLPQERWLLDSFSAVGHRLPDLASPEAVETLLKAYNTTPGHWWSKGPVLDPYLHHVWCQRLLTRLTGIHVVDTNYVHYSRPHWYDYKEFGPRWQTVWDKNRNSIKLNPIEVPARQPFTMADEDRRLLFEDLDAWRAEMTLKAPLVRTKIEGFAGTHIIGAFEITLTNHTKRELILHTKPRILGEAGVRPGSAGSLSPVDVRCVTHLADFVSLQPAQKITWRVHASLSSWDNDHTWLHARLHFHERGEGNAGWRGRVATPWISVKKENIREQ
jgi:hypothetical protein